MKTLVRLILFLKNFRGKVLLSILAGIMTAASGIGLMGTSAFIIALAALHPSIAFLQVAIVGVRFFGISRGIFRYLERLASHDANFRLLSYLRVWFYEALEPLAPARLAEFRTGDLLSRGIADIETLEDFYVRFVSPVIVCMTASMGVCLFVGSVHALPGWVLAGGLGLAGAAAPAWMYLLAKNSGRAVIQKRGRLQSQVVEMVQGMGDLTVFNRLVEHERRIFDINADICRLQINAAFGSGVAVMLNTLISGLTLWLMLWITIPMVRQGVLDGVTMTVILMITLSSFEITAPLGTVAQTLENCLEAGRRLFEIVDIKPDVVEPDVPQPLISQPVLSLKGLRFTYPGAVEPALDGVSFDLPVGAHIAIVGPSGAGKSTLVRALLRFWEVPVGSIFLGEQDIRDLPLGMIRGCFSVVAQSTFLFSGTIRQNLLVARPDAANEELTRALDRAQLLDWVNSLPEKMDTWIGENGLQISAGERQRLAVARALLRDTPIWILDEPTANLDADTEARLVKTLLQETQGKSVLWITHRLAWMEKMDEVIVLDQGRIVERGKQTDLLESGGLFASMWKLQFEDLLT